MSRSKFAALGFVLAAGIAVFLWDVLRTSVGLLADPASSPTDEQRRILVATIERNADRMQRLIGDILDLSRFRSGSIRLQLRRFDACELLRKG